MRLIKQIPTIKVKRTFVIADLISSKHDRRKHLNFIPENIFKQKLEKAIVKGLKMKEKQLDKIIKDEFKLRLKSYDKTTWYIAEVNTNEVGVWKKAGGLPLAWTEGSLADTAKKVKHAIDRGLLKGRVKYSVPNMLKSNVHLLQKEDYLLPIVFQHNTGTRGRKKLNKNLKGNIDDGCMRSIALAVAGYKTLRVYFGVPKEI